MDVDGDDILTINIGYDDVEGLGMDEESLALPIGSDGGRRVTHSSPEDQKVRTESSRPELSSQRTDLSMVASNEGSKVSKRKKRPQKPVGDAVRREVLAAKKQRGRQRRKENRRLRNLARKTEISHSAAVEALKPKHLPKPVPLQATVEYQEMVPGISGSFYARTDPNHKCFGMTNLQPTPPDAMDGWDQEEEFNPEELMDEEDRPWMVGYKRRKPSAPQVLIPEEKIKCDLPVVVRHRDYFFESSSRQYDAQVIKDNWLLLERQLKLRDMKSDEFPPARMPEDTVKDFIQALNDPLRRRGSPQMNKAYINQKPKPDDPRILYFLAEIKRTRVLCVNTEGTQSWITPEQPRTMITFGILSGYVIFFNNIENVPQEMLACLPDVSITKIGCGLAKEFSETGRSNIEIRNWVETGALRLALYSKAWRPFQPDPTRPHLKGNTFGARRFGIEEQVDDLKVYGFLEQHYARTSYHFTWEKGLKEGRIPHRMWPHVWENGAIPCSFVLMIVINYAETKNLDLNELAFPILQEALDLCRGRDPVDFQKRLEPAIRDKDWWTARQEHASRKERSALPAGCLEMSDARRTFADFYEPIFTKEQIIAHSETVYQRFCGPDAITFPKGVVMARYFDEALMDKRCSSCASDNHVEKCPRNPNPVCEYEHDGEDNLVPHSTLMCPVLHGYCRLCLCIGHHERVHYDPDHLKTPRELRLRFFRSMIAGAWTSLPFLIHHPEGCHLISHQHWRRSYDARGLSHAAITRYVLQVTPELIERAEVEQSGKMTYKIWKELHQERLDKIRQNALRGPREEQIPIPRDFVQQEIEKRTKKWKSGNDN